MSVRINPELEVREETCGQCPKMRELIRAQTVKIEYLTAMLTQGSRTDSGFQPTKYAHEDFNWLLEEQSMA